MGKEHFFEISIAYKVIGFIALSHFMEKINVSISFTRCI